MFDHTPKDFEVLVSVITPAYNAHDVLTRAVNSVQAQTLADWEMIIVDDGSSDATGVLAERCAARDPRVRVIHPKQGQQGAAAARNLALKAASGRYVAFLDADDEWMPEKLALQVDHMQTHGAGLSYTGFLRVGSRGARRVRVPEHVTLAQLRLGNCVCCSSAMYDRAMFGTVLMADMSLRQDYALWLTLLSRLDSRGFGAGIDAALVRLHVVAGSLSSNKWRATRATWAMHHKLFGISAIRSAFYVASHSLRRLWRG